VDPLLTAVEAARERGRVEIDENFSDRELVTSSGPYKGFLRPNRLIRVTDSQQVPWTGLITSSSINITSDKDRISVVTNLNIEKSL
jgi:hypothetical protein